MSSESGKAFLTPTMLRDAQAAGKRWRIWDTRVPGLFVLIQPSGLKAFYLRWRRGESDLRLGRYPHLTIERARNMALERMGEVAAGGNPTAAPKAKTLREFADGKYAETFKAHHPKTWRQHLGQFRRQFEAEFFDLALSTITAKRVREWRTAKLRSGIKPSTINRNVNRLQGCLSAAVADEQISVNPLAGLPQLQVTKSAVVRYLSDQEERRLLDALAKRDDAARAARDRANAWREARDYPALQALQDGDYCDHLTPLVLLSLGTGMRRGSALALEWSHLDRSGSTIRVPGEITKNGEPLISPVHSGLQLVLSRWRAQGPGVGRIFPVGDPKKAWTGVLASAEIGDFRWHDLRHSFASKLLRLGVPLATISELLGHKSIETTSRHYAHLAIEQKASAVERLAS